MPAMPTTTTAAKPVATKRFQLPALDFKFGSLTDGTNIPPPIPSPVQEVPTPPKTPTIADLGGEKKEPNGVANGQAVETKTSPHADAVNTTTATGGVKRAADDAPSSPTLSTRGSLRRLLSKNLLHNAYDDQASIAETQNASRPPSRTASVMAEERKAKRSSGWFRRFRSDNHSVVEPVSQAPAPAPPLFDEAPQKPAGPPPPMIPELSALETKVDTSMGDDLFKEIK
ncbi:uncharacterized protein PG998_012545 [Apiospora kogelbergensis]|uniref:Uncharacterized protein n=1 Tax=Apiospora kogelbergensis TaxID=1337665 RepID=A0AAW0QN82_9PEZI